MSWLKTVVLAVVQGLTEFLPVSSDGHLTVATYLLNRFEPARQSHGDDFFYMIALHVGTLAAILISYRRIAAEGAAGLLADDPGLPSDRRRTAVVRAGLLACVAVLPLVPVAFLKDSIEGLFGSPRAAAVGFLITAVELLLVARLPEGRKGLAETTWLAALLIGVGQAFAVLPGVSRSGSTIAIALALGLKRSWAVGFSLLIAVPAILGGAAFELLDLEPAALGHQQWTRIAVGTILAGVIGYGAIVWLTRVVARGRLWYFSVYLLVLALVVYLGAGVGSQSPTPEGADAASRTIDDGP